MLRRRPVRALLLGGAVTALAALAPAQAATAPPAVTGGLTQAYRATYYEKVVPPKIPVSRYYLTGTATDEATKLAGAPTATFSKVAPTGGTDLVQATKPVVGGVANSPGNAYWTAPYTGEINGKITISWTWQTHNPLASSDNVVVHVIADPGTPDQKEIGSGFAGVTNADGDLTTYTETVEVLGTVKTSLQLAAQARYADTSEDLTVHYGSTSAPSYFEVPIGVPVAAKLPTTQAVPDDNPLVVATTRIGRKAAEPTLGVTPKGNAFVSASDFDNLVGQARTLVYGSYDGNKTWANVSPLILGQPTPPATLDPYVYVDPETGRIFNDDLLVGCSYVQWSDDEGKSFETGNPLACDAPVDDHQTVVAGNPPPGMTTTGYPNAVYYCVNKVVDVMCARSLDGGRSFLPSGNPAFMGIDQGGDGSPQSGPAPVCGGLHGHIVTDPAGRLLLPKGHCDQPWLAISDDGGQNWQNVRINTMLVASHQTSVAVDTAGNFYYTWIGKADLLPYLSVSKDHGQSWSLPVLIAPPGVAAVNFPTVDVREPGHLVITFPGTTGPKASPYRPWNYYLVASTDALEPRPTFHSTTANPIADPVHRGPCLDRCAGMLDFLDVVVAPKSNELWAAGVDTCTAKCVTAKGPTLKAGEGATDGQGIVVRQLAGPGLTALRVPAKPAVKPPVVVKPAALPATGLGLTIPVAAVLLLGLSVALRRRRA